MSKVKRNDTVVVITGKDKGKTGKVLKVFPKDKHAIVEGVNFAKKHVRKTKEDQQGGVIKRENPINISNLAVFCKRCSRATKVGNSLLKDGTKSRFCKKCNEVF